MITIKTISDGTFNNVDLFEGNKHPKEQVRSVEKFLQEIDKTKDYTIFTNSVFVINAFESYTYEQFKQITCRYILDDRDVSNCTETIYKQMARPLQDLENIKYAI